MKKLIRDKVMYEILGNEDGRKGVLSIAKTQEDRLIYAIEKITEEFEELLRATGSFQVAEEAGDLIEAVFAFCSVKGVSESLVDEERNDKAERSGTFEQWVIWEVG